MDSYTAVQKVIEHIAAHQLESQSLEEIASSLGVSKRHLERLFQKWAGITPAQFGRYLKLQYAKEVLAEEGTLGTALRAGLSSQGRLHDLFVDIEAMTPGEYKNGGAGLLISYTLFESIFGLCLVGATNRGVCAVLFCDTESGGTADLRARFPKAQLMQKKTALQRPVITYLRGTVPQLPIKLHVRGTNFQLKVWEALLSIPEGKLRSYTSIAAQIKQPRSARAIGTAIGQNPAGFIIPCHRVLKANGALGGYHWGEKRKRAMLAYEALRTREG